MRVTAAGIFKTPLVELQVLAESANPRLPKLEGDCDRLRAAMAAEGERATAAKEESQDSIGFGGFGGLGGFRWFRGLDWLSGFSEFRGGCSSASGCNGLNTLAYISPNKCM